MSRLLDRLVPAEALRFDRLHPMTVERVSWHEDHLSFLARRMQRLYQGSFADVPAPVEAQAVTADEFDHIRALIEESHLTVNPTDTTETLVARLIHLSWPESAAASWFSRWQVARQMNNALSVTLSSLLTALEAGKPITQTEVDEAWQVLSDVKRLDPEDNQ